MPARQVTLLAARVLGNESAGGLFEVLGFEPVRVFHTMRITLDAVPEPPAVPQGIVIREFQLGVDDRAVFETLNDVFAEHWGLHSPTYEEWHHRNISGTETEFDPSLWFLATDGGRVVGIALCAATTPMAEDTAEVTELGVRRDWRGRGLGLALLVTAFRAFSDRGIGNAELGVDAQNETGALRLYERAGMRAVSSFEWWQKHVAG